MCEVSGIRLVFQHIIRKRTQEVKGFAWKANRSIGAWVQIPPFPLHTGTSSNGRTSVFGTEYGGSTPSVPIQIAVWCNGNILATYASAVGSIPASATNLI